MYLVFFGLSLTSSWGNGHATTYRGLFRGLSQLGHRIEFFEHDVEWYASHRDLPDPPRARLRLYRDWKNVRPAAKASARAADAIVIGSYFPDAIAALDDLIGEVRAPVCFYDIDTPITLAAMARGECAYLLPRHVPEVDLYLSFTGGPVLRELRDRWHARLVRPLYCACDETHYRPRGKTQTPVALSFLGTYAPDRQNKVRRLFLEPARSRPELRFCLAGSLYPDGASWPPNVGYAAHLEPARHPEFYTRSRFTLNLTRQAMVESGYAPSIRLFEAAACGTPVISDPWPGMEEFFQPGREILVAHSTAEVLRLLDLPDAERVAIGAAARARVLDRHTSRHRARELISYLTEVEHPASTPA